MSAANVVRVRIFSWTLSLFLSPSLILFLIEQVRFFQMYRCVVFETDLLFNLATRPLDPFS